MKGGGRGGGDKNTNVIKFIRYSFYYDSGLEKTSRRVIHRNNQISDDRNLKTCWRYSCHLFICSQANI